MLGHYRKVDYFTVLAFHPGFKVRTDLQISHNHLWLSFFLFLHIGKTMYLPNKRRLEFCSVSNRTDKR